MKFRKSLVKEYIKEPYIVRIEVIDKSSINKFVRPEWHRDFRNNHVNTIRNGLLEGKHFIGCITVNEIKGKYRILDANHRIEAIREILKVNPKFKIETRVQRYSDLNKEQELDVYTILNKHKPENILDVIKAYCIDSFFVKETKNSFPIRVMFRNKSQTDVNALPITTVCFPYVHRKNVAFLGSSVKSLAQSINNFTEMDIDKIRAFFKFYRKVFGDITKDNLYCDATMIGVVAKLYYTNVGTVLTEKRFQEKLEIIKLRYTANLTQYRGAGFDKAKDLYLFLIEKMKVKNLFNVFSPVEVKEVKKVEKSKRQQMIMELQNEI